MSGISSEKAQEIVFKYLRCYNRFEFESMSSLLDEQVVFLNTVDGREESKIQGREQLINHARDSAKCFERRTQTPKRGIWLGTKFEIYASLIGKLKVDMGNGFKKGDVVTMEGKTIFTITADAKICLIQEFG